MLASALIALGLACVHLKERWAKYANLARQQARLEAECRRHHACCLELVQQLKHYAAEDYRRGCNGDAENKEADASHYSWEAVLSDHEADRHHNAMLLYLSRW